MALYQNDAESGHPHGTDVTATRTEDSGDRFMIAGNGGTVTVDTAQFAHGARSFQTTFPANQNRNLVWSFPSGVREVAARYYIRVSSLPDSPCFVFPLSRAGGGTAARFYLFPSGAVRADDSTGTAKHQTPDGTIVPDVWYRFEIAVKVGASDGIMRGGVYEGDSTAPVDGGFDLSNVNTGNVDISNVQFGKSEAGNWAGSVWLDDMMTVTGSSDLLGPVMTTGTPQWHRLNSSSVWESATVTRL